MAQWGDEECYWENSGGGETGQGGGDQEDSEEVSVVELRVPLCCDDCEEKIMDHLMGLDGVEGVLCDQDQQKVTVSGSASSDDILTACQELFPDAELWD